jgi:hypothetical protein
MAMSDTKLSEVISQLEKMVTQRPPQGPTSPYAAHHSHLLSMPPRMRVLLAEGRREKLMRWLGFMQGALWQQGVDLEDLKRMNMPDEEKRDL